MKNSLIFLFVFCLCVTQAQTKDPLLTKDKETQEIWVNNILNKMTNEEKIGQLFMVQEYSNKSDKERIYIKNLIGSFIFHLQSECMIRGIALMDSCMLLDLGSV